MRTIKLFSFALVLMATVIGCGQKAAEKNDTEPEKASSQDAQVDPAMKEDTTSDTMQVSMKDKRFEIRSKNDKFVTISTDYGDMVLELYHDVAPAHADSFAARVADGFYNGTIFHRIINHFMIQGGDPTGTGMGNAGYFLNAEFSDLPHEEGTLSMARGRDPNSASCQFFICLERNRTTQSLDGQYTVFGHLIKGFDVLHAIGEVPVGPSQQGENSKPLKEVAINKAYMSDAEGNSI